MSKYGNKKVVIRGITFDSKAEGERYLVLQDRLDKGEIADLKLQPEFILLPDYERNGKKIRRIIYHADFQYMERNGASWITVVEDVKGFATPVFKLKQKMLLHYYRDIDFRLVK